MYITLDKNFCPVSISLDKDLIPLSSETPKYKIEALYDNEPRIQNGLELTELDSSKYHCIVSGEEFFNLFSGIVSKFHTDKQRFMSEIKRMRARNISERRIVSPQKLMALTWAIYLFAEGHLSQKKN